MKKLTGYKYLTILTIFLLMVGWTVSGVGIYFRLLLFISLVIICSYVWDVIGLQGLAVERTSRSKRSSVGKVFDERLVISNSKLFPCIWVELEDLSSLPQKSGSRIFTSMAGNQERSFISRNWITRRGSFDLGPMKLTSGDLLGIFRTSRTIPLINNLVVYPLTFDIDYFPVPGGLLPGGRKIRLQTNDISPNVTGIREYSTGDPIKRIHWPSTARKMTYMIKLFEQDPKADIWLFIDSQKEAQIKSENAVSPIPEKEFSLFKHGQVRLQEDSYEYAISTAASLAKYLIRQKLAIGLASSGKSATIVPAEPGDRQLNKIFETLAFLEPDGILPFTHIIQQQSKVIPMGSGLILLTPMVTNELVIALYELIRRKLFPMIISIQRKSSPGSVGQEEVVRKMDALKIPFFNIFIDDELGSQIRAISKLRKRFAYSLVSAKHQMEFGH